MKIAIYLWYKVAYTVAPTNSILFGSWRGIIFKKWIGQQKSFTFGEA